MAPAPRDIYEKDVDFAALALQDAAFAKKLKTNKQLDFTDPESVIFNYIVWLQDLLDSTSPDYKESYDPNREVLGVDIGTGASCIYPLLATRQRPNWRLVGTDIDEKSLEYANRNVARNGLAERVRLLKVDKDGALVPKEVLERFGRIDFILTNPPFYPSSTSLLHSLASKSLAPNSACTGSPGEMITPGGETGFIARLIEQSSQPALRHRVQWWTSMLGKLASLGIVVRQLKEAGVKNWVVSELVQGGKTRRWVVGWSWGGMRPSVKIARGIKRVALRKGEGTDGGEDDEGAVLEGGLLPFPSEFEFPVSGDVQTVATRVAAEISLLHDLRWQWKAAQGVGLGVAKDGDCWSRKARRRRQLSLQKINKEKEDTEMREDDASSSSGSDGDQDEREPAFAFKIHVHSSQSADLPDEMQEDEDAKPRTVVSIRWIQGQDHVLFESFCGWLRGKVDLERGRNKT